MDRYKKLMFRFILVVFGIILAYSIEILTISQFNNLDIKAAIILRVDGFFKPTTLSRNSIKSVRANLNQSSLRWRSKPIPFSNIKNMKINTDSANVPVRIYTPSDKENLPIIIYSHGGSWISGSLDDYESICRKLSKKSNSIVISVAYRLAPENPFPAALNDIYNVLEWTNKNSKSLKGDSNKISLIGDSAGGNLSAAVALLARDKGNSTILCQVLIYPATNIYTLNTESWTRFSEGFGLDKKFAEKVLSFYVPNKELRKDPYVSPLLENNLKNLPDTLIITAELDPLRDEGEAYGAKLKAAGISTVMTRYKKVPHGFLNMDKVLTQADIALDEISTYLKNEYLKNK